MEIQYFLLGLDIYLLATPTKNSMSKLVAIIAYIKPPIIDTYDSLSILSLPSFDSRQSCLLSFTHDDNGVLNALGLVHIETMQDLVNML